jgi:hypothetical protein
MPQIVLDSEAGQVSAELARRGIPAHARIEPARQLRFA